MHPLRATAWQLRTKRLVFGPMPAIMGIVNITPDSFSDGGKYFSPSAAIDHALRMEDQGADIIDVGGESTRPYSQPVSAEDEYRRVIPVIEALAQRLSIPISVDTSKSDVAEAAVGLGAEIINDVTGLEGDPAMPEVAKNSGAAVCVMHMQGTPQTMQDAPQYGDVVQDIHQYLLQRDKELLASGFDPAKICLDPGIGFGKTHEHNIALVRAVRTFLDLGRPILVGHSRKGFIGKLIGNKDADRSAGTLGVSMALAIAGVQVVRVHDVQATRDAFTAFQACSGI